MSVRGMLREIESPGHHWFEEGRGHKPRNVGSLAGKSRKTDSPIELPEGMQPCQHLDFSSVRPISDV